VKILVTGATGLIGSRLIDALIMSGYSDIRILARNRGDYFNKQSIPLKVYQWDLKQRYIDDSALRNIDCIIHLAGENIASGHWNDQKKRQIRDSRVQGIQLLMDTIRNSSTRPSKFIVASAIGIYGDRGEEILDSTSELGSGFLSQDCKEIEQICLNQNLKRMQVVCLRIGIVLAKEGGLLRKMLPIFKLGIAGVLGIMSIYQNIWELGMKLERFPTLFKRNVSLLRPPIV